MRLLPLRSTLVSVSPSSPDRDDVLLTPVGESVEPGFDRVRDALCATGTDDVSGAGSQRDPDVGEDMLIQDEATSFRRLPAARMPERVTDHLRAAGQRGNARDRSVVRPSRAQSKRATLARNRRHDRHARRSVTAGAGVSRREPTPRARPGTAPQAPPPRRSPPAARHRDCRRAGVRRCRTSRSSRSPQPARSRC